jgi:hypothetical protein
VAAFRAVSGQTEPVWQRIDLMLLPTTGTIYRIAEITAEPFALNARLGHYTNFTNLLDLSAIAVPNGFQSNGLPAGVTLLALSRHGPGCGLAPPGDVASPLRLARQQVDLDQRAARQTGDPDAGSGRQMPGREIGSVDRLQVRVFAALWAIYRSVPSLIPH